MGAVRIDRRKLKALIDGGGPGGGVTRAVMANARAIASRAADIAPGSIGDTITVKERRNLQGGRAAVITANHPAAKFVHDGTRPHIIRAKNARQLVFFWERENKMFFGKRVSHPGIQNPVPFLTKAAEQLGFRVTNSRRRGG